MRPTRLFLRSAWACASVLVALSLTACTDRAPEFITSQTTYSSSSARELLSTIDVGELAQTPTSEAQELRQQALADLRGKDGGSEAANLITKTFPSDTGGVPLYVEQARYDGEPAWLIVEAVGREGGSLKDRRLWVVTPDGDVLFSAMK